MRWGYRDKILTTRCSLKFNIYPPFGKRRASLDFVRFKA